MRSVAMNAIAGGSDLSYGLELVELEEGRVTGHLSVRPELKQPDGAVHAGVYAAIAVHLTSTATAEAVARGHATAVPMSSQTSFLRPITDGVIHAVADAKHRGRTTWVWEVSFADDRGRLCVLTRITIAVSTASES